MKKTLVRSLSTAALFSTLFAGNALASTYKVEKGDTLSKIALKFKTNVNEIKALNNLTSDTIYVNQTLKISSEPAVTSVKAVEQTTYTVVKGDALIKIANRYSITVGELQQWNNLSGTLIFPGQVLKVSAPGQTVVVTAPAGKPTTTVPVQQPKPTQPAPAPQAAKPAPTTSTSGYTVVSGDSLSKIGVQFGMTVQELKTLNNLSSDLILVGQKLKVKTKDAASTPKTPAAPAQPAQTTQPSQQAKPTQQSQPATPPANVTDYIIKSGDTLGKIALQYKTTVQELKILNNLKSDMIYVGQTLKVSGTAQTTGTKPTTGTTPAPQTDFGSKMVAIGKNLMGTPYVWGGSSLSGFDCSGFIYYAANQAGYKIGRYSAAGYYDRTYYVDKPQPGDLVFFEGTYKPGISHVGIYLGGSQFIHADEKHGIMISNLNSPYYTKHFSSFKRFY